MARQGLAGEVRLGKSRYGGVRSGQVRLGKPKIERSYFLWSTNGKI